MKTLSDFTTINLKQLTLRTCLLSFTVLLFFDVLAQKAYEINPFLNYSIISSNNSDTIPNASGDDMDICGFDSFYHQILKDSIYRKKFNKINTIVNQYVMNSTERINTNVDYVIPVVVHIIHGGEPIGTGSNLSYDQIISQIDALNTAFNSGYGAYNGHANGDVDTGIQFCLASETWDESKPNPQGTFPWTIPAEPGVMRYNDPVKTYHVKTKTGPRGQDELVNMLNEQSNNPPNGNLFPFDKYLNIYVVTEIAAGILGYAPNPIEPLLNSNLVNLDGIVIQANLFGDVTHPTLGSGITNLYSPANGQFFSKDEGKVLAHEVGHYLFLAHTFHDCSSANTPNCLVEGDFICDTDPCILTSPTNWFCSALPISNNCNNLNPFTQWDNFMYYIEDPCQRTFTNDQKLRMVGFIQSDPRRSNMISPANHADVGLIANNCVDEVFTAAFTFTPSLPCIGDQVTFTTPSGKGNAGVLWTWDFGDGIVLGSGPNATPDYTYNTTGTFSVTLTTTDASSNSISTTQDVIVSDCPPIVSSCGNWFFGQYAGLDFSSGTPKADVNAHTNNTMNTREGCVSQSDEFGNLLFYSNGIDVYNKNHDQINLTPLEGWAHSSQVLAVPYPGNPDEYYLFYNNIQQQLLYYSIIAVTNGSASITSADNLVNCTCNGFGEQITAIPHCNGVDYWVLAFSRLDKNIIVYLLTSSGIVQTGVYPSGVVNRLMSGTMKASPDGNRLALALHSPV